MITNGLHVVHHDNMITVIKIGTIINIWKVSLHLQTDVNRNSSRLNNAFKFSNKITVNEM